MSKRNLIMIKHFVPIFVLGVLSTAFFGCQSRQETSTEVKKSQ